MYLPKYPRPLPRHLARWFADQPRPGISPEDALDAFARNGGWVDMDIMPHGGMDLALQHPERLAACHRARRLCTRYGTTARFFTGIKLHIIKPTEASGWQERGFDYRWVAHKPRDAWWEDWARWTRAGWKWRLSENLKWSPDSDPKPIWTRCWEGVPNDCAPLALATCNNETRTITPYCMVLDLRIPECRAWLVSEAMRFIEESGADAAQLALKNYLFRYPNPPSLSPDRVNSWNGSVHATHYGPGEWEKCAVELLHAFKRNGVYCVLRNQDDKPRPNADRWDYLQGPDRDLPLGEAGSPG